MGLGEARTLGFTKTAKFGQNWHLYPCSELKVMYLNVMSALTNKHYGEYLAMELIFGTDVANKAAKEGQVIAPASTRQ